MADPYAVAKKTYPILEDYPYKIVNTPDKNSPFFLEHFPPGEPGSLERPRPKGKHRKRGKKPKRLDLKKLN